MLTDTGELSDLLDAAQRRWPSLTDRKALLLRLAKAGGATIAAEAAERGAAIADTAGALSGAYEPNELERLREDWPE
jgi:ABC-type hemin transport system substrate-binding protein